MTSKPKKFLTIAQLAARWGDCSKMLIERRLREDPKFPRPIKLGGRRRLLDEDDVERYERSFLPGGSSQSSEHGGKDE